MGEMSELNIDIHSMAEEVKELIGMAKALQEMQKDIMDEVINIRTRVARLEGQAKHLYASKETKK